MGGGLAIGIAEHSRSVLFLDCAESTGELRADVSQRVRRSCSSRRNLFVWADGAMGLCFVVFDVQASFGFALRTRVVFGQHEHNERGIGLMVLAVADSAIS